MLTAPGMAAVKKSFTGGVLEKRISEFINTSVIVFRQICSRLGGLLEGVLEIPAEMLQSADKFWGELLNGARHGGLLRLIDGIQKLLRPGAALICETDVLFPPPVLRNQDDNPLLLPLPYNGVHRCLGDQPLLADLLLGVGFPVVQSVEDAEGISIDAI